VRPPLKFFVAGLPAGQPRVKSRLNKTKGGKLFVQTYTPTTVHSPLGGSEPHPAANWKMLVRAEAEKAWHQRDYPNQWTGPLCVNETFYFPRPKAHFRANGQLKENAPKWHTSKPDRDNCDKVVLDALTGLCLFGDDCQVCDGTPRKLYAAPGQQTGCLIEIKEAEPDGLRLL
jgi:Holliday junction resolvase RusA-like endonuclease